ncbi:hypothetical protein DIT68_01480 [Brumimicrobium oceani]|uniref:Uncharacterized protein n=1 Tax=Brumimicrobium oceani TaxID=2100725 RepID=A0A2U2XHH0_9FLAO|nr:hypothetical protein DIT68_01480 [Brumimicrobium oceani]
MENNTLHIDQLKSSFNKIDKITIQDLFDFYNQFEDSIKRTTIDWRIHQLTEKGILHRISRGVYSVSEREVEKFEPEVSQSLKQLSRMVLKKFPFIDVCLWSTRWLNEFMLHQPGKFYTILEVENDAMEAVFYELSAKRKDVFLNPSEEIMNKYVINAKEPILIIKLVTEAPTTKVGSVKTSTLEKILVDIQCEPAVYATFQGAEMNNIYQNAFEKYHLNEVGMLRYAKRRGRKEKIKTLIGSLEK